MKMDRIIPMLPVRSIAQSVAFYGKLGFIVEKRNDSWGWALLAFGDCRIMTTFYGMTEFRLDDPDANRLWIGQNKSQQSS